MTGNLIKPASAGSLSSVSVLSSVPASLSVIVPMLNEQNSLPELLVHLSSLQAEHPALGIVLVDGGSHDESVAMAEAAGFRVVHSSRGRARQMNAGAQASYGECLLFLHADTRLPPQAIKHLQQALEHGSWGRFDVSVSGSAHMLRVVGFMINLRSRLSGIATGDQAMFMRRKRFEQVGCFPDQPLMEDIELSKRLRRYEHPQCLRARVTTSGRRWMDYGVWRTIFLMWRLRWAYWRGVPAEQLAKLYI